MRHFHADGSRTWVIVLTEGQQCQNVFFFSFRVFFLLAIPA